jgi:hypothetical protein
MLQVASALKGSTLLVTDGQIGTVSDFLFDDRSWKIRWLVVDTGSWLTGRKVLLHASAIKRCDLDERVLRVDLTKMQVKDSPGLGEDQPVSRQDENNLYAYYGWDPIWDTGIMGGGGIDFPGVMPIEAVAGADGGPGSAAGLEHCGDPHLRSIHSVTGYHVHATDGVIGHIQNFLLDDRTWDVRYLIVDTRNWWPGKEVLLAPYAITTINWLEREVRLGVAREKVRAGPAWTPVDQVDEVYERHLHQHYGWPGYGW